MWTARMSVRTASPPEHRKCRKKQAGRAPRPRLGTIPRWLWHEASSCDRRLGRAAGCAGDGGQAHESKSFEALLDTVKIRRRRRPAAVAGDKGYSYPRIRAWLARRGIEAVIPTRSDQPREPLDKRKYRRRNVVEWCFGWLKESRRVATRYEELACHYLAMVKLAMIQRCLRLLDPSNRT